MLGQKHLFFTPKLDLDVGESVAATIGYETYGRLNPAADNAVLICPYFSASSHAAGRYHPDEESPGWWDALIGPGKPFDTDQYFVIAVDSLCNLNVRDPKVITTGPASIDPATGRPFGRRFPQVTIRDNVRLQHQLIRSLSIETLFCVAGPSMGGFQALEWAVTYPAMVQHCIAVAASHQAPPIFALAAAQAGIDAIESDPAYADGDYYGTDGPVGGLTRAAYLLTTLARSNVWIDGKWGRRTAVGTAHPWADRAARYAAQAELEQVARERAQAYDANHYIYLARAAILHDIGHGNGALEGAARKIRAKLLMLPISSDICFPVDLSLPLVEAVTQQGGMAELVVIDSPNGHLAAVYESARLAEPISRFLNRNGLH